jgi:hypothetical protein
VLAERRHEVERLLGRRRQIEVGFVAVGRVVVAQPAMLVAGPVVEILRRRSRERVPAEALAEIEEEIIEPGHELGLCQRPHVGRDERAVQERHDDGRVIGRQQPPGGMRST